MNQSLYHTFQRYRTLRSNRITALPIVILMPHSACNCRCVMCDIWKDNKNLKQLREEDITGLLSSLKKLGTKQVLMSGGEALLHPNFFRLCTILKEQNIGIVLLSTGLALKKNAARIVELVDEVIVSLDGDETTHDQIRNINGAFARLREGIEAIRSLDPSFRVTARTVIHKLNYHCWSAIIESAKSIGIDGISFLPADVSSTAFNRELQWTEERQLEVALDVEEAKALPGIIDALIVSHKADFENRYIAESIEKIRKIASYYGAIHGFNDFPFKKCNAPWVSTVIEPDGSVRPCFFHPVIGNIRNGSLTSILNGPKGMDFRKGLDMDTNDTCKRCVCYLNLPATVNPAS
jgi:MoaA/NifB/PqqE/SkfB family radical SAM enzyme